MVCLFWTIHAGISYRELNKAQRYLGLFLLVSMLLFLYHAIYYSITFSAHNPKVLTVLYSWSTLTTYPLYYLYIKSITDYHNPGKYEMALLFTPGIIATVSSILTFTSGLGHEFTDIFISIVRPIQTVSVCVISLKNSQHLTAVSMTPTRRLRERPQSLSLFWLPYSSQPHSARWF